MKYYSQWIRLFTIGLVLFLLLITSALPAQAQNPIVRAILFYSPTCPHCHKVISEDLPPLIDKYGDKLFIAAINIQTEPGNQFFSTTLEYFDVAEELAGVPMLVVGDTVLIGSLAIPEEFPGIIENGLAAGGIDWSEIPGLNDFLHESGILEVEEKVKDVDDPIEEVVPTDVVPLTPSHKDQTIGVITESDEDGFEIEQPTIRQLFIQDIEGNSIAVLVLAWMVYIGINVGLRVRGIGKERKPWPAGIVFLLLIIGLIVSNYLSFVEMSHTDAVCGPVGDCNTVQQSPYAYLFGVIPIGILGVIGYCIMGFIWILAHCGPERLRRINNIALFSLAAIGMLFSIYLTFLEPFVIGATCAWCLTSAVVVTLLTWNSAVLVFENQKSYSYSTITKE